jgi:uncharacterized surface protein with fasciclin (FAS1) repeats
MEETIIAQFNDSFQHVPDGIYDNYQIPQDSWSLGGSLTLHIQNAKHHDYRSTVTFDHSDITCRNCGGSIKKQMNIVLVYVSGRGVENDHHLILK